MKTRRSSLMRGARTTSPTSPSTSPRWWPSLVAAVLAALASSPNPAPSWLVALVAAVPAAAATVQSKLDIRGRAGWYLQYSTHVEALYTELRYDPSATVAEVAKRRAQLAVEMERQWSGLG